jgi:acetyl/propionyl-CoA carboxylase alpha subunit
MMKVITVMRESGADAVHPGYVSTTFNPAKGPMVFRILEKDV